MKKFKNENNLMCLLYKPENWKKGLNFITEETDFIQAGSWWYDKGKILDAHTHNEFPRTGNRTQEVVFIVCGSMKVNLYTEDHVFIESFIMNKGDLGVFLCGGHGYEILEDDTKIIETKNGPFLGVTADKIKFDG